MDLKPRASGGAVIVALTAFFTLVDLFATQAVLPMLAGHYGVTAAAMGLAVNASTLGMAVAGLGVAAFGARLDRRSGIAGGLLILAIPTALLAFAPNLLVFSLLRIVQGLCMATAFSLTLAYLGESLGKASAGAFAAYITGNVASNLVGRLMAAAAVLHFGLKGNFFIFAGLNLAGAALVWFTVKGGTPVMSSVPRSSALAAWRRLFGMGPVVAGFGVGFCILAAFLGVFTYVNFVLVRPPLALGMMAVGVAYFVFLPSILTTPVAGVVSTRFGVRPTLFAALALAAAGLPLLLTPYLPAVLGGMVLVAVGTFFAQAVATGFVAQAAGADRGAASGLYLASYFLGGLAGSAVLGQVFDCFGWNWCVFGVGAVLAVCALLAACLTPRPSAIRS